MKTIRYYLLMAFGLVLISGLALTSVSCNNDEDEKINCNATELQLEDIVEDLSLAIENENCSEIVIQRDKLFDVLRKSKNCEWLKADLQSSEYDNVEDFIHDFDLLLDMILDDLNC